MDTGAKFADTVRERSHGFSQLLGGVFQKRIASLYTHTDTDTDKDTDTDTDTDADTDTDTDTDTDSHTHMFTRQGMHKCQKRPYHMAKEAYHMAKEAYHMAKKRPIICQKII